MLIALQISTLLAISQGVSTSIDQKPSYPTVFVVKGPVSDPVEKMKPKPRFRFTTGSKAEIQKALRMDECEVPIGNYTVVVLPTEIIKNVSQSRMGDLLKEVAFLDRPENISKSSNPELHKKLTEFAIQLASPQERQALSSPDADGEFRVSPTYVIEVIFNGKPKRITCEASDPNLKQPQPPNSGKPVKGWMEGTPPPTIPTQVLNYTFLSNFDLNPGTVARDAGKAIETVTRWVIEALKEETTEMCKTGGLAPLDSSKSMTLKDVPEPFRSRIREGLQFAASMTGSPLNKYYDHPELIEFKPIRRGASVSYSLEGSSGLHVSF